MRREEAVKEAVEALRAEKRRQTSLNRQTSAKIHSLIGAAVAADFELDGKATPAQRAYIGEALMRFYNEKSGARILLEANGWLQPMGGVTAETMDRLELIQHRGTGKAGL
jgi:hypothetical protein